MRYAAYGHTLDSAIPLPELRSVTGPADFSIRCAPQSIPTSDVTWAEPARDGRSGPWLWVGRTADALMLRFEEEATFTLSDDGREIAIHLDDAIDPATMRHLLIDLVVPLAVAHRGQLVLHASSLVIDGHAIAFIGPGGAGKSTLAAAFGRAGYPILADDALVLVSHGSTSGAVAVHGAYAGVRVWPDVLTALGAGRSAPRVGPHSSKRRLAARHGFTFTDGPTPLKRLYLIRSDEITRPQFTSLSRRDTAMAALQHALVLDPSDQGRLTRQLAIACDMLANVEARDLRYPRRLDRLGDVQAAVQRDLAM